MRCFGLLVTLLHISSKTADEIVENNEQVILAGLEAETFWVIGTHDTKYIVQLIRWSWTSVNHKYVVRPFCLENRDF